MSNPQQPGRPRGRPRKPEAEKAIKTIRLSLPPAQAAWLRAQGNISRTIQRLIAQEMTMKPYNVNEQMLGSDATVAEAQRMVELLDERGYDAVYGHNLNAEPVDFDVWDECLDIISQEFYTV